MRLKFGFSFSVVSPNYGESVPAVEQDLLITESGDFLLTEGEAFLALETPA